MYTIGFERDLLSKKHGTYKFGIEAKFLSAVNQFYLYYSCHHRLNFLFKALFIKKNGGRGSKIAVMALLPNLGTFRNPKNFISKKIEN